MTRHKEQRVGVFVDVQNMYYSAKNLYDKKVNFRNILKDAVAGRKLIRAIAYVIKADVKDEKNFHGALDKIGFEVKSKDLQIFFGGAKKGDWDIGIAMDVMKMVAKLDVVVLVSGDGDFKELLEHASALGCRTEVMAFSKTASSKIKEEADLFMDMEKYKGKYLIAGSIGRRPIVRKVQRTSAPKPIATKPAIAAKPATKPAVKTIAAKPVAVAKPEAKKSITATQIVK